MQAEGFSHAELYRRARRAHERRLREAVDRVTAAAAARDGYAAAGRAVFDACVPVVPYVPAATFLARETAKLASRDGEPRRVALVVDAARSMHGVSQTIDRIREHGVPGWEVEVIGTDPRVDRRLPAVAEVEVPFYAGLEVGVPSVPELVETLAEGRYDLVHVASPGPAGVGAAICARIANMPLIGSYHTELAAYAAIRTGDATLESRHAPGPGAVLRAVPRWSSRRAPPRTSRWSDRNRVRAHRPLDPWGRPLALRPGQARPGCVSGPGEGALRRSPHQGEGRRAAGRGVPARAGARSTPPSAAGRGGPEEGALRERLGVGAQNGAASDQGPCATFLGWLDREQLARAYASADLFLFCSRTDTYGQVIAEAQASGLPVVAVAEGGPVSLISDRHTGWLCPPDPESLAGALAQLASSAFLRERLSRAGRAEVRGRSWEAAFEQLATGYERALARARRGRHAAAQTADSRLRAPGACSSMATG